MGYWANPFDSKAGFKICQSIFEDLYVAPTGEIISDSVRRFRHQLRDQFLRPHPREVWAGCHQTACHQRIIRRVRKRLRGRLRHLPVSGMQPSGSHIQLGVHRPIHISHHSTTRCSAIVMGHTNRRSGIPTGWTLRRRRLSDIGTRPLQRGQHLQRLRSDILRTRVRHHRLPRLRCRTRRSLQWWVGYGAGRLRRHRFSPPCRCSRCRRATLFGRLEVVFPDRR